MEADVQSSSSLGLVSRSPSRATPTPVSLASKQRDIGSSRKSSSGTPSFLSNLGRATLRGIRRCPQCGVFNGTRSLSCKNKACGVSLRNAAVTGRSGRRNGVQAVRVILDSEEQPEGGASGGGPQVFSVCHRGRGAAQWGFVELILTDTAIATGDGSTLLTRINLGHCFLPSCRQGQRSTQGNGGGSAKPSPDTLCVHIQHAIECRSTATPLTLKSSVLEGLQASVQAREELWRLATESPGPLVQRVAKDTLVVKCHSDSAHPLGLLHLSVGAAWDGPKSERSIYHCTCQGGGRRSKAEGGGGGTATPCLHFYACVCAFASDEKMAAEFSAFISYKEAHSGLQHSSSASLSPEEKPPPQPEFNTFQPKVKKQKCGNDSTSGSCRVVDERALTMSFNQWLAGVTERIHHSMYYQHNGKPPPLIYFIPQEFFEALQQRLSLGSKKRRLPKSTTAIVRNDVHPPSSLSTYTWHITNLTQVKRIFDTPELPLEVSQSFVKNADGSYSHFHCPEPPPQPPPQHQELVDPHRTDRQQPILPMQLRTYLKVGPATAEQKEASPFVIQWTPHVLPRCGMGELRISFEFIHQQSGHMETSPSIAEMEEILQVVL
ncbi:uncharacterized protein C2orf42 homolog isoform X2 [Gouania willdenowi]|uniref:Putative treble-clef zinc-finger domain-containing protein n=2 Tax=Gouania willdenowi TaxID=441366 RepID=A0A8C5EFK2_GOUWI|nr:uncharacterized protein C2orf42 homolog isoform X2 [Gouania willdenowi]XP_028318620.1 uncharacterized protein C2orf42 homolog isoform X2 [Gouania willdenowi]XP_028318621.1 uncharacterized protein C2orf42 homolog isoform X2 [Gouania willdenowi]